MPERSVKGIWFTDYAKMVSKLKHLAWDKYLTPEDFELVEGRILPAQWYPLEIYQRLALAAFELVGQGKPEMARLAGQSFMDQLTNDEALGPFLKCGDPERALRSFIALQKRLITLGEASCEKAGPKQVCYRITWAQRWNGLFPFAHNFAGFLSRLVEVNGGKNIRLEFDDHRLEERDFVDYSLTWD